MYMCVYIYAPWGGHMYMYIYMYMYMYVYVCPLVPFGFCSEHSESRGLHVELYQMVVAMSMSPCVTVCNGGLCCGARCMFRTKPVLYPPPGYPL